MTEAIRVALDRELWWIIILMRMSGMVFFNSLLGRNNIPAILRIGLTLILTYLTASLLRDSSVVATVPEINTWVGLSLLLLKELLVGYFLGYLISVILAVPMVCGEVLDMQLGISMAKMYDPQSNISMPLTGSVFNAMFILNFFMVNGHLALISMMVQSFWIIPPGGVQWHTEMVVYIVNFFGTMLLLALKLALPFVGIQLMTEVAVGILMKAIPQINVFVLNIQLKLLMGFFLIMVLVPQIAAFMDDMMTIMLDSIRDGLLSFFA